MKLYLLKQIALFFVCITLIATGACKDTNEVKKCDSKDDCLTTNQCQKDWCLGADLPDTGSDEDASISSDISKNDTVAESDISSNLDSEDIDGKDGDIDFICPEVCNQGCEGGACHIVPDYFDLVQCPDDIPCLVECVNKGTCRGVKCGNEECTVLCEGIDTCSQWIDCGSSPICNIQCNLSDTCAGVIKCRSSKCNVACSNTGTCCGGVQCGTNSCQIECAYSNTCNGCRQKCDREECGFSCQQADVCECTGPGCWPTP